MPTAPAAIPRTSSIRSLFNLISSPFRSPDPIAPTPGTQDDGPHSDENGSENGSLEGSDGFMSGEDEEGDKLNREQDRRDYEQQIPSSQTVSNFRLPPPPLSSKEWPTDASDSRFLSAHAPLPKQPSIFQTQPTYSPSSSSSLASSQTDFQSFMSRSQTMPSLNGSPSSVVGVLGSGPTSRSQTILQKAVKDMGEGRDGLSSEELEECRMILSHNRNLTTNHQPAATKHQPFSAASPLFHPGSSIVPTQNGTPTRSTSSGLTRSTSNLSFLSPSRLRPSNITSSFTSSPGINLSSSTRSSTGTPRRRPIYLGPGSGATPRRRPDIGRSFLDLESNQDTKLAMDSPGKRRRLDNTTESADEEAERKEEDWIVERALSGLGAAASPRSSSKVVSNVDSSTPSSPFTFTVPFESSVPSTGVPSFSLSTPQSSPLKLTPPTSLGQNQSIRTRTSLALSTKYKNPSLVAPSPLRQSTRFADSPEGKKAAVDAGASPKVLSKTSKMMMDLIREENVKFDNPSSLKSTVEVVSTPSTPSASHRQINATRSASSLASVSPADIDNALPSPVVSVAASTIYNPYQSSGIVASSPRRNPRRSIAATSRSRASMNSPARSTLRGIQTQDQVQAEKLEETNVESTPTSKRQRNELFGGKNAGSKRKVDEDETKEGDNGEHDDDDVLVLDDLRTINKPLTSMSSPSIPNPSWTTVPSKVLFAGDMSISGEKSKQSDVQMDVDASPTRETLNVLKNLESPALRSSKSSPSNLASSISSAVKQRSIPESLTSFGKTGSFGHSSGSSVKVVSTTAPKASSPSIMNGTRSKDPRTIALDTPSFVLPIFNFRFAARLSPLPRTAEESKALVNASKVEADRLPKIDLLSNKTKKTKVALSSSSATGGGFNWAAAGLKPTTTTTDKWICPTCSISNTLSASKCVACEEPQPGPKAPTPIASTSSFDPVSGTKTEAGVGGGGFNWAAAGMKRVTPSTDKWACPTCGILNGLTDFKCLACEEPRSASVSTSIPTADVQLAAAAAKPATGGFNWAAAGMKAPEKKKGWECGVCMVQNGEADSACVSCETKRG
ncbi:nucleoporin isoform b [Phaffia rhodozyma]|uniref:Nuclear pore complex protein Nup153 n=1 Tax=Phaffia rhodozyma TaxID=264483 RepID=A0A0F7STS7_PHARH|nr:nucleoporin isoform b [Phaffia rhodozyma]